jgi:uncharacterized membrane protein YgdD (TMEM256/DUF423 family)
MGAAGVALAAVAAHRVESPALVTAANILMIHAAAGVGIAAIAAQARSKWLAAAGALMLAAVALFAGDVTYHTLTATHIFPYAAPAGGSLAILSWIGVALTAAAHVRR